LDEGVAGILEDRFCLVVSLLWRSWRGHAVSLIFISLQPECLLNSKKEGDNGIYSSFHCMTIRNPSSQLRFHFPSFLFCRPLHPAGLNEASPASHCYIGFVQFVHSINSGPASTQVSFHRNGKPTSTRDRGMFVGASIGRFQEKISHTSFLVSNPKQRAPL
jgi:hypothetical protein